MGWRHFEHLFIERPSYFNRRQVNTPVFLFSLGLSC